MKIQVLDQEGTPLVGVQVIEKGEVARNQWTGQLSIKSDLKGITDEKGIAVLR